MALMTEYRPPKVTYKSCSFGDWMIATACGGLGRELPGPIPLPKSGSGRLLRSTARLTVGR